MSQRKVVALSGRLNSVAGIAPVLPILPPSYTPPEAECRQPRPQQALCDWLQTRRASAGHSERVRGRTWSSNLRGALTEVAGHVRPTPKWQGYRHPTIPRLGRTQDQL